MTLAIFDLDNTLLHGDSDHAWGEFLVEKGIVDKEIYKQANDLFYQQYQNGQLNILEYLQFALKPLTQHKPEKLSQLHKSFMLEKVAKMRLEKADALLKKHRDQGDFLLIITATNAFVTTPIAEALGVDAILATDPEIIDGVYTGKIAGTPCFQDGKVTRLNQWLKDNPQDLKGSFFYSDSHNDIPLLKMVDNPVAVDADTQLQAFAKEQGWPHISLR
ncbi:MAG: HAD family hydrolase [Pseudomonadales bacterium]|nr:HAD family hydrolase [Pseudomonadales bacterium]